MRTRTLLSRLLCALGILLAVAGVIGFAAWYELLRTEPQNIDAPEERFKYGSIGTEQDEGVQEQVNVRSLSCRVSGR